MTKLIKRNKPKPSKPLTSFLPFCLIGQIIAMSLCERNTFLFLRFFGFLFLRMKSNGDTRKKTEFLVLLVLATYLLEQTFPLGSPPGRLGRAHGSEGVFDI